MKSHKFDNLSGTTCCEPTCERKLKTRHVQDSVPPHTMCHEHDQIRKRDAKNQRTDHDAREARSRSRKR